MSTRRNVPWGPALSSASGAPAPPAQNPPRAGVRLPVKAGRHFEVLVDGEPQIEGGDFFVVGRLIVFTRPPAGARRGRLRRGRSAACVQVRYELDGHMLVASGLEVEPL